MYFRSNRFCQVIFQTHGSDLDPERPQKQKVPPPVLTALGIITAVACCGEDGPRTVPVLRKAYRGRGSESLSPRQQPGAQQVGRGDSMRPNTQLLPGARGQPFWLVPQPQGHTASSSLPSLPVFTGLCLDVGPSVQHADRGPTSRRPFPFPGPVFAPRLGQSE